MWPIASQRQALSDRQETESEPFVDSHPPPSAPLDSDVALTELVQRPYEDAGREVPAMDELPAVAVGGVPSVSGDAAADPIEASSLLDVEVGEFARPVASVAAGRLWKIDRDETTDIETVQMDGLRGYWPRQCIDDGTLSEIP